MTPPIEKTTEESLVMAILELSGILNRRGTNVTAGLGLTTQQWLLLLYLSHDPNIHKLEEKMPRIGEDGWLASELAEAMHVSRPYITNLATALQEKQLISSTSDKKDHRKKFLTLTPLGLSTIEKLQPFRKEANKRLFNGLSEADKAHFLSCLSACMGNLTQSMVFEEKL